MNEIFDYLKHYVVSHKKTLINEEISNFLKENECYNLRKQDVAKIKKAVEGACIYLNQQVEEVLAEIELTAPEEELPMPAPEQPEDEMPDQDQGTEGFTHTVVKGDTFWELAREYLGDPRRWEEIQQANLRDDGTPIPPRRLPIGTVLKIPS